MWGADLVERAKGVIAARPDALIAIVGPTATGKTELAIRLAEALDGEVVSADSIQIYRGFDKGSGKPTVDDRRRAVHHLVDLLDATEEIDARTYGERATVVLADIKSRGRRPILCGGTFLWVKSLVFGLAEAPPANEGIRAAHRALAQAEGREGLHRLLAVVDPKTAARLHPNDLVRVSRALEVFEISGKPMSVFQDAHGFRESVHPATFLAISHSADILTERIEGRVRAWLAEGWIDETRELLETGYAKARAMGSVGYKEIAAHLRGELALSDVEGAIVRATRVYARRQRTFLNHVAVSWV